MCAVLEIQKNKRVKILFFKFLYGCELGKRRCMITAVMWHFTTDIMLLAIRRHLRYQQSTKSEGTLLKSAGSDSHPKL